MSEYVMLKTIQELEKDLIVEALTIYGWNITRVAKVVGMSRATLYRKVSEYGLSRKKSKLWTVPGVKNV